MRIVDDPVGIVPSVRQLETSTPRRTSSLVTNVPSRSLPITPTIAVGTPSRAVPHAVIADELPSATVVRRTSVSVWSNTGGASSSTRMSAQSSPTTSSAGTLMPSANHSRHAVGSPGMLV